MDGDILLTPYTNKNDQGVSLVASGLLACVSKPQDCLSDVLSSLHKNNSLKLNRTRF